MFENRKNSMPNLTESKVPDSQVCRKHLNAIAEHLTLMHQTVISERNRRKQIQPAAVAYQTLRRRVLEFWRMCKAQPGEELLFREDEIRSLIEDLPKTIDG